MVKTKKFFVYVWEYRIKEENRDDFEQVYGPTGDWVQLFQKSEGYLGTELHWDVSKALRYVTLDYWESREIRDDFRQQFAQELADLDRRCESLTEREIFLGDFEGFGAYRGFSS
ncbi:MAG: hypothetical protein KDJ65_21000 [Anaerolineae bacterium]|nr:hypothetical protein [Anaerolineae bacterium]